MMRSSIKDKQSGSGEGGSGSSHNVALALQLYGVIKWTSGAFAGQFCYNVKIEWIRDFERNRPWDPLGYGVEWRVPLMPRMGWNVYDCTVIEVSDDLDSLRRKKKEYAAAAAQANANENALVTGPPPNPNLVQPHQPQAGGNDQPQQPAAGQQVQPVQHGPAAVEGPLLQQRFGTLQQVAGVGGPAMAPAINDPAGHANDQVKIGKTLTVTKSCLIQAKAARTPSAMTMFLTRGAFSKRRLQLSSYAGQRRQGRDPKPALKKYQSMRDIQVYVLQRFPMFSEAAFGSAVNACTGRRAAATEEMQFIDIVSDDEME